jgi:hypothetical protein
MQIRLSVACKEQAIRLMKRTRMHAHTTALQVLQAVARALIAGGCGLSDETIAEIDVLVSGKLDSSAACLVESVTTGTAEARG